MQFRLTWPDPRWRALRALAALAPCVLAVGAWAQGVAGTAPVPAAAGAAGAPAAADEWRLQVTAPFLEMHTGPGRGYPVFHVVERAQWVVVEMRRTDWFRVRTEAGHSGWVPRRQLESTLTAAGGGQTFRDALMDGGAGDRLEFGAAWGQFASEPMLRLALRYRLADALGAELAAGQVQGLYSGTSFWHLSLSSEPWAGERLAPFFSVGMGAFRDIPNASLVDAANTDAQLAQATLGLRWRLGERFVARLDWSLYVAFVSDQRSREYRALSVGLGFTF